MALLLSGGMRSSELPYFLSSYDIVFFIHMLELRKFQEDKSQEKAGDLKEKHGPGRSLLLVVMQPGFSDLGLDSYFVGSEIMVIAIYILGNSLYKTLTQLLQLLVTVPVTRSNG